MKDLKQQIEPLQTYVTKANVAIDAAKKRVRQALDGAQAKAEKISRKYDDLFANKAVERAIAKLEGRLSRSETDRALKQIAAFERLLVNDK